MDAQKPDSQCSKISSHHPPLMAYRPMVSSATRTHRLEKNISSTPHLSFFPRPEARIFSQTYPCRTDSCRSCDFHAEFPFHPPAGRPSCGHSGCLRLPASSSHQFFLFSSPHPPSFLNHYPTPRSPAQGDCERIKSVPFTATHSATSLRFGLGSHYPFSTFNPRRSALSTRAQH